MKRGQPSKLQACIWCSHPVRVFASHAKRRKHVFCTVKCYHKAVNACMEMIERRCIGRDVKCELSAAQVNGNGWAGQALPMR